MDEHDRAKAQRKKKRDAAIEELRKKIIAQADSLQDGWVELTIQADKDQSDPTPTIVRIARIPFDRWLHGAIRHRQTEWQNISPLGLKMQMDDRNHSDWWLSTGLSIDSSYRDGFNPNIEYWRSRLDPDDEDYVPIDPKLIEETKIARKLEQAALELKFDRMAKRGRNSVFLVSSRKRIEARIALIRGPEDIQTFVDQAQSWKKSASPQEFVAVVPDCSIAYDPVIRNACAIITQIGSAAAHLVKVAREDKIPVILCPTALTEFFDYEKITIHNKNIR